MEKKKIFWLAGIVATLLFVTLLLVPVLFKGKIVSKVKQMANESLSAKLDFKDAELSLFRSFPQLDVRLNNLTINGTGEFEGKTLVDIQTLSTSLSLSSLWKSDGLTVSEIILYKPVFNLLVSPTGKSNWDIGKPSTKTPASDAGTKSPMQIELSKIQILGLLLTYRDDQSKTVAGFNGGNFELSGSLKGFDTKLHFKGETDSISFQYGGKQLANGLKLSGEGALQANFDQKSFRFLANKFLINKLPIEIQGTFVMGDKADNYDLTFDAQQASLAELISFMPQSQQQKLKSYEKGGVLSFSGLVKGTCSDQTYPAFLADLKLTNGKLKYPGKPFEINQIELVARITKPQGILDSLKISLPKIQASIGNHPFVANLGILSPTNNPILSGEVIGEIDFASLKQTIPMDSMLISGMAMLNLHFNGPYSAIDKGEYANFQTKGELTLRDFSYRAPMFPSTLGIQSGAFAFDSKQVTITSMKGKLGLSDFTVDGSFQDYWAYLLKNGTAQGNIKFKSDNLDVTQMMNGGTPTSDSTAHSDPMVVPARIDLTVQAEVNHMLYSRMDIRGTTGKLVVKDQRITLDQLSMNMLKGKMVVSGVYFGAEKSPADFNFKIDVKDFDLPTAYQSVGLIRHILPIAGNSKGTLLSGLSLSGKLGKDYAPYFETLNGGGSISIKNLELVGANMFSEIGKYFRKDLFTNVKVNDFTSNILLTNGALAISPFTTKVANQEVTVSGSQSLALDLNYQLNFKVNKNDLAADVTNLIGLVPGAENIDKYPIRIDVAGNLKKPAVNVDLSEAKNLVAREFTKKANTTLKDVAKQFGLDGLFK